MRFAVAIFIIFFGSACSHKVQNRQKVLELTKEQLIEINNAVIKKYDLKYKKITEPNIDEYLKNLVGKVTNDGELAKKMVMHIYQANDIFLFAGFTSDLYVSLLAISQNPYESELAFLIARQLVAIKQGFYRKQIESTKQLSEEETFKRLHALNEDAQLELDEKALQLIYNSHYDPRSAVSAIQRSGGEAAHIRLKRIREQIAKLPPMRDPIVNTEGFKKIQSLISRKANNAGRSKVH